MEYQDYYAILGVPKTANEKEIRSAYRKLARKYHPDVNSGDKENEEKFKQLSEAYEVLSDPEKRKKYDQLGSRWREYEQWQQAGQPAGRTSGRGRGQAQPFDWSDFVSDRAGSGNGGTRYRAVNEEELQEIFGEDIGFSAFFETFFGGRGPRQRAQPQRGSPRKGRDLESQIEVTLEDAYSGADRLISIEGIDGTQRLRVKIPPGVDTGSRIRIAGRGNPGQGGAQPGDLYLVVQVQPHHRFERRGRDLFTKRQLPFTTLILGGEEHFEKPDGKRLALKIPAGSQDGRVFVLRGQGMPSLNDPSRRGDLQVEVHARLPVHLTDHQRGLIADFAKEREHAA